MKRTMAVLFAGLMMVQAAGLAFAGEKKDPARWQEKQIEKMEKDLGLTAEQKTKITAIIKESGEKMRAEMEQAREAARAARAETDRQIKAVLTPEQAQKFEKQQAERKAKMEKKEMKKHGDRECDMQCGEEK